MRFRMIPFAVPQIELNAFKNFLRAFTYGRCSEDNEICQLEEKIAQFVGVRYAVAFASGRYALYLLYKYFGCAGKRVIVPAYTCIPAADAFRWAGAEPLFVDIDLETYNPQFESSLRDAKNVGAVCLSYLYGLVSDPAPFVDWARSAGIPVIEDAAIALGAKVHGRNVGSIGDAAVFSLQSSKIISCWRGGVITTDNIELYKFLKEHKERQPCPSLLKVFMNGCLMTLLRCFASSFIYGFTIYPIRQAIMKPHPARLLEGFLDHNPCEAVGGRSSRELPSREKCCFTNPQAKLALASLDRIGEIIALRRKYATYLEDGLKGIRGVVIPCSRPGIEHAYGRFPIRIEGLEKVEAVKVFASLGIEIGLNYPYIIPETEYFRDAEVSACRFVRHSGYKGGDFPNAEKAAKETILLPFHTYLRKEALDHMIAAVRRVVELYKNKHSFMNDGKMRNRIGGFTPSLHRGAGFTK